MTDNKPKEVIYEMTQYGNTTRITAIDTASGTEITMQVPANLGQLDMQRAAYNKLDYVMNRKK